MRIPNVLVEEFKKGVISRYEGETLPRGCAEDALNWMTQGDHIELRGGRVLTGTSAAGTAPVTGLKVAAQIDGTKVPFYAHGQKLKYYASGASTEIGSDLIGSSADGEDVCMDDYHSLAGAFLYVGSPFMTTYKIPVANPGSYADQDITEHRGLFAIKRNATYLWRRRGSGELTRALYDPNGLYRSYIDKDELSDYAYHSNERGAGSTDGTVGPFTGYLPQIGTYASGTLTAAANPADGDTVTIGSITYRFKDTPSQAYDVQRDAVDDDISLAALASAINADSSSSYFAGTLMNPDARVTQVSFGGGTLVVRARAPGTAGNAIATTETGANLSWGAATMTGGSADSGKKTALYVSITSTPEKFNDDRNGGLVGTNGGSGTIDYATGAWSVTFGSAPPSGTVLSSFYSTEDSTDEGILDFSKATPRVEGEGFVLRQDDGGAELQNIGSLDRDEFAFHTKKTWRVSISDDDVDASNVIFRANVGIEYWRALAETGEGLYYVDSFKKDDAYVRLMIPSQYAENKELPQSISDLIALSPYRFDKAVLFPWGPYLALACRTITSNTNNRTLFYHTTFKSWDVTDFPAAVMDDHDGSLLMGAANAPNLYTLFSGHQDAGGSITNYWITGKDDLDTQGLKTTGRLLVRGLIQAAQSIEVSYSLDNGAWVTAYTILGNGSYVDSTVSVTINTPTIGSSGIGGAYTAVVANPYEVEFPVKTAKFKRIRLRFRGMGTGAATVSAYEFRDNRYKGTHSLPVKTV